MTVALAGLDRVFHRGRRGAITDGPGWVGSHLGRQLAGLGACAGNEVET